MTAAALLRCCGINCVVLERQSREYVEQRQRAGIVPIRLAEPTEIRAKRKSDHEVSSTGHVKITMPSSLADRELILVPSSNKK